MATGACCSLLLQVLYVCIKQKPGETLACLVTQVLEVAQIARFHNVGFGRGADYFSISKSDGHSCQNTFELTPMINPPELPCRMPQFVQICSTATMLSRVVLPLLVTFGK